MEIEELIGRCRQGDAEALEKLYMTYALRMRRVCRRYVSDEEAVRDIVHDSFVIIFSSFDKLCDDIRAEGWMMGIARNVAMKYAEYHRSHPMVALEDAGMSNIADGGQDNDICGLSFSEIMKLVDRLPEGYGKVFRLSVFEGLSHKEIAGMLGIEPHSSSSQLARAKKLLRRMLRQSWIIIPLMIALALYQLWNTDEEERHVVARLEKNQIDNSQVVDLVKEQEPERVVKDKMSVWYPAHVSADTIRPEMISAGHLVYTDSMQEISTDADAGVIVADTISSTLKKELQHSNLTDVLPNISAKRTDWRISLAYSGNLHDDIRQTDNFMTMPSVDGVNSRSTKLYNWGEYMDYVIENAPMMDSVNATNMMQMALINSNHPLAPLTETKRHDPPFSVRLSVSHQLAGNWSVDAGLCYMRMKSTFESGDENTLIHRTQRIHYLGIPLKLSYHIRTGGRWSIYASGGAQIDIPVGATLTTRYIYRDVYEHLGNSPDIGMSLHVPWQWSVDAGIGFQYRIISNINLYIEPSVIYYLPASSAIETYNTEHPLTLSLPIGIRLSW